MNQDIYWVGPGTLERTDEMGIEHLEGKRTGRPRGSKSSPWLRDARWAYRNLDNQDAKPPSALSGRLLQLGRKHPDRFAACLARLEAQAIRLEKESHWAQDSSKIGTNGDILEPQSLPRRVKKITIPERKLFSYLREKEEMWLYSPPADIHVVSCETDPSQRAITLILESVTFPEVAEGEEVPELEEE